MSRKYISRPTLEPPLITIPEDQLDNFFSVDEHGRNLTLRQFILNNSGESGLTDSKLDRIGAAQAPAQAPAQRSFDRANVDRLVNQYLDSIPEDEVLEVVGQGAFTSQQLREEVRNRTAVGEQIIAMILADHAFVEQAIKSGRFKLT
jgi:hypothetical protein